MFLFVDLSDRTSQSNQNFTEDMTTVHQVIRILTTTSIVVFCHLPSPCPDIFRYDTKIEEDDRWYGVLTINTKKDNEPRGVFIYLRLDTRAELMGNWFGEVTTSDNTNFAIKNSTYKLKTGSPLTVKCFVRHNTIRIPSLERIILNGEIICPVEHINSPSSRQASRDSIIGSSEETQNSSDDSNRPQAPEWDISSCGVTAAVPNALVTNGQNTIPGQWPWHAALYHSIGLRTEYKCGGTLISKQHVITAAHCVTNRNRPLDAQVVIVYLGKYNIQQWGDPVQSRDLERIYVHPKYNSSQQFSDIAILKCSSPLEITNFVRPCCLWDDENKELNREQGTVVGWDQDLESSSKYYLKQVKMPVVRTLTCIQSYPNFFSIYASEEYFCAGFANGTSVCNGDSGSGMVFPKKGTGGYNTVWQLKGIVSVGVPLNGQRICNTSQYVVFTNVSNYINWIKEIIN